MAALPYIQLYISDFQADTAHLTLEQKGAYLELIMNYWQTEKPLNNADLRIASMLKISKRRFQTMEKLLSEFFTIEGDIWTHKRIEYDLEKVLKTSKKRSFAGAESARSRANKRLTPVEQVFIYRDKDIDKDKDRKQKKKISIIKDDLSLKNDFITFWQMYPRKVGKLAAEKSFEKALKSATPQQIFEGVVRYLRVSGSDPKFIVHPATWLNQGRWMDINLSYDPKVKGEAHNQSSNQFEASEATPVPPVFTIEDAPAKRPMPSNIRELALGGKSA